MLFLSLSAINTPQDINKQIDGIELRLDLCPDWDLAKVSDFLREAPCPVMLTLRKASQGGKFSGSEEERQQVIQQLLSLKPSYFDLEADMRPSFLEQMLKKHPETRFVLSHHDFERTPDNLEEIYNSMSRFTPFSCKIAAMAKSANDALKMLLFAHKHPGTSAICMGERGSFARVLGKVAGNVIDYAISSSDAPTGPGQISIEELMGVYRYALLNRQTAIYGLIGNPVDKSLGAIHHNRVFHNRNVNAVYVKITVDPDELEEFFSLAKKIGIRGLSVTMPLKEKILPFIDEIDPKAKQIGAVNTLLFKEGRIYGTNTDGSGALDAIEKQMKVRGKKVVLIAAGGAARSIAFEARSRGAEVVILNRTLSRAEEIAKSIGGKADRLDAIPSDYDILVNCSSIPMPIDPKNILSKALVMDIVYVPKETPFLKEALLRGCRVVYGEEMFLGQAQAQTKFWLDN